jgi:hypothetical protein
VADGQSVQCVPRAYDVERPARGRVGHAARGHRGRIHRGRRRWRQVESLSEINGL